MKINVNKVVNVSVDVLDTLQTYTFWLLWISLGMIGAYISSGYITVNLLTSVNTLADLTVCICYMFAVCLFLLTCDLEGSYDEK